MDLMNRVKISPMGLRILMPATALLAVCIGGVKVLAQEGQGHPQFEPDQTIGPAQGGTLEVPTRRPQAQPTDANAQPLEQAPVAVPTLGTAQDYQNSHAPKASDNGGKDASALPYLGVSVQFIVADDSSQKRVQGFEIVSVDPQSPAEAAGLRPRRTLSPLAATGTTVGQLAPPFDLIVMPLLKKAGKLGADGDLIIAIDDNLVLTPDDLRTALASSKSGDIIYLTVLRPHPDGSHETLKLPVKLGGPLTTDQASTR